MDSIPTWAAIVTAVACLVGLWLLWGASDE